MAWYQIRFFSVSVTSSNKLLIHYVCRVLVFTIWFCSVNEDMIEELFGYSGGSRNNLKDKELPSADPASQHISLLNVNWFHLPLTSVLLQYWRSLQLDSPRYTSNLNNWTDLFFSFFLIFMHLFFVFLKSIPKHVVIDHIELYGLKTTEVVCTTKLKKIKIRQQGTSCPQDMEYNMTSRIGQRTRTTSPHARKAPSVTL